VDFHFDLSAYEITSDQIEFSIRYNQSSMSTVAQYVNHGYIFLSADGGATWHAAGAQLNMTGVGRFWDHAVVDLQDMLDQAGQTYTSEVVVRVQGSSNSYLHSLSLNDAHLQVVTDSLVVRGDQTQAIDSYSAILPGEENAVVAAFDISAHGNDQTITDLYVHNSGTTPDSAFEDINIWVSSGEQFDPNMATNLTDSVQTQFSGGVAHFANLQADVDAGYGNEVRVWITVDMSTSVNRGDVVQIQISESDIELDGFDSVTGNFPIESPIRPIVMPVSSLPFQADFTDRQAPGHVTLAGRPGDYPSAGATGDSPTMDTMTHPVSIGPGNATTRNQTAALNYRITAPDGRGLIGIHPGHPNPAIASAGIGAVDFHFDLSEFSPSQDQLLFSFMWRHYLITTNNEGAHVFISTDGGNSWLTSAQRLNMDTNYEWRTENIDISSAVRAASGLFSDHVVVRIQSGYIQTITRHMQIAGVSLVRGASLEVSRQGEVIDPGTADLIGTMVQNVPVSLTYRLSNLGVSSLALTDPNTLRIDSAFNADVVVSTPPASSTVDAEGYQEVTIEVTALGAGPVLFAVEIDSSDTLKSPYVFTVVGTGLAPKAALQRTLGDTIIAGGVDDLGNRPANVTTTLQYFILNQGSATLQLHGSPPVAVVAADNVDVAITRQPTSSLLAPSGFQSFELEIMPQLGSFSFELVIPNNDTTAPEYRLTMEGNGSTTSSLTLRDADGGAMIPHSSVYTTRNLTPGSSREITFLIENTGNANLELIGSPSVQVLTENNLSAEVIQEPLETDLAPGNFTPMIIEITPNAIGAFNADVRILSNDAAVPSFLFTIAGFSARSSSSDDDSSCSVSSGSTGYTWVALLAILGILGVSARRTRAITTR
jgi:hypothetical protein